MYDVHNCIYICIQIIYIYIYDLYDCFLLIEVSKFTTWFTLCVFLKMDHSATGMVAWKKIIGNIGVSGG